MFEKLTRFVVGRRWWIIAAWILAAFVSVPFS